MDLVPGPYSAAAIASLEAVSVANIDSPTELNSIAGAVVGERRVCYQAIAGDNVYTTYYWDSADSSGASTPYVMAGSTGFWIAGGGKYTNGQVATRNTAAAGIALDITDSATSPSVARVRINSAATTHASAGILDILSSATTSSDIMLRTRSSSTNRHVLFADGSAAFGSTTAATTNSAAALVLGAGSGGIGGGSSWFGSASARWGSSASGLVWYNAGSASGVIAAADNSETRTVIQIDKPTTTSAKLSLGGAGNCNVLVGTTTDDGVNKLQVSGGLYVSGNGTFSAASPFVAAAMAATAGAGFKITAGSGTKYNWIFASQYNVDNGFEITPSTVVGGSTFSVPAIQVSGTGVTGIAGASTSLACLQVGTSNPLTGTNQQGVRGDITVTSACTAFGFGFVAQARTAAAAFTCPLAGGAYNAFASLGAGSTVTRCVGTVTERPTVGANNAGLCIVDAGNSPAWAGSFAIASESTQASQFAGNLGLNRSAAGSTVQLSAYNSDNTNASSHAQVSLTVGGASAGDPWMSFTVGALSDWSVGVDNSDGDAFKIDAGYGVGSLNTFVISRTGHVLVGTNSDYGTTIYSSKQRTLSAGLGSSVDPLGLQPSYTGAFTVARAGYIALQSPALAGSAVVTDACAFYLDAAAGTHKALDAGTTKTTPGAVNAWLKIDVNGTVYYIPAYTSKTA